MRQFKKKSLFVISFVLFLVLTFSFSIMSFAEGKYYQNKENGNKIVLIDRADLFTDAEEEMLLKQMSKMTTYGHIMVMTISDNPRLSTSKYTEDYYLEHFGLDSGTLFMIDMDNREIYLYSEGKNYDLIPRGKSRSITDNVYRKASKGKYFECAMDAINQSYILLSGGRISEPMRYISTGLLSFLLAMLINFIIVRTVSKVRSASGTQIVQAAITDVKVGQPDVRFISESKTYSPVSSSSGGSGHSGGGRSGGGHSGGGHHGGGGGHRF